MKRFELAKKFGFLSLTAFIVFSITTLPVKAFYNEGDGFYKKVNFIEDIPKLSVIIEEDPDWKETSTEDVYREDSDIEYTYTYDSDTEYTYIEDISTEDNGTEDTNIEHRDI